MEDTLKNYFARLQKLTSPEDRIMSAIIEKETKHFVLELKKYINMYPCTYRELDCRDNIADALDDIFGYWEES